MNQRRLPPELGNEARENRSFGMMLANFKQLLEHALQPRHTPGRVFNEHALGIDADMPPVSNVFHEQFPNNACGGPSVNPKGSQDRAG